MADPIKEPTDAEVAAKTGFGEPAEESEEDATETEEATETTEEDTDESEADESAEDTEESVEETDKKSVARQKRGVSKDEKTEVDEPDESEDEAEEAESEEEGEADEADDSKGKRTVPYSLLKSKNQKIKTLETELNDARKLLEKSKESGDDDAADDAEADIEKASKDLAEELGIGEEGAKKILKAAVKLSSKKSALPKEVVEALKTLDDMKKDKAKQDEIDHFNKEWTDLSLAKQYPNASPAALKEAQDLMDKLAHSKDHAQHDLDYILYKHKAKFETILKTAGKKKSGETGKRIGKEKDIDSDEEEGEDMVDIEHLTPDVMKRREQKDLDRRRGARGSGEKDYVILDPTRRN